MVHTGWFINGSWWWLALWLPAFALALPIGSGRKERRP
jgi:hypothetical protein